MKVSVNILYKETQQLRGQWLWAVVILCILSTIGVVIAVSTTTKPHSSDSWLALALFIPLEILILYLFSIIRLETIISSDGIFIKWWPFQRGYSFVSSAEVKQAYFRKGPFMSYGHHWHFGYGRVHNMAPGKGIQLVLKSGRKIFLGTQKLSAFQTALEKVITVS